MRKAMSCQPSLWDCGLGWRKDPGTKVPGYSLCVPDGTQRRVDLDLERSAPLTGRNAGWIWTLNALRLRGQATLAGFKLGTLCVPGGM